jgi:hypothetical protein
VPIAPAPSVLRIWYRPIDAGIADGSFVGWGGWLEAVSSAAGRAGIVGFSELGGAEGDDGSDGLMGDSLWASEHIRLIIIDDPKPANGSFTVSFQRAEVSGHDGSRSTPSTAPNRTEPNRKPDVEPFVARP